MRLIVGHIRGNCARFKSDGVATVERIHHAQACEIKEVILHDWSEALMLITMHGGTTMLFRLTPNETSSLYCHGSFGIMGKCKKEKIEGAPETLTAIFEKAELEHGS